MITTATAAATAGIVDYWSRRYFVLLGTELRYFEAETDVEPKCVIELTGLSLDSSAASRIGRPLTFELYASSSRTSKNGASRERGSEKVENVYTLTAYDEAAFARWVDELGNAINGLNEMNWLSDEIDQNACTTTENSNPLANQKTGSDLSCQPEPILDIFS
eukprot:SAG11_NODE_936_length_6480_cov_18.654600_4_plen_162_part_00